MKDFEAVVDEKQAERDTRKLLRGTFTLDDFLNQLATLKRVGSVKDIYEKMPLFGDSLPEGAALDDKTFVVLESLIRSMTKAERAKPQLIDKARAERIAKGSGRKVEQVFDLLQRFQMMHTLMQNLASSPGLLGALPGMKQLSALRKLKGQNMSDLFGGELEGAMRSLSKGQRGLPPGGAPFGGMPGLPGLPGLPQGMPHAMPGDNDLALPAGMTPEQYAAMLGPKRGSPGQQSAKDRERAKAKRRAEKVARKKSRRR